MKKNSNYDNEGNASHYDENRVNSIVKYERVYGTLAVMTFCEINADKYRDRIGKKDNIEQEVLKIKWYENAAKFYFDKLGTDEEIIINNKQKQNLPWKKD